MEHFNLIKSQTRAALCMECLLKMLKHGTRQSACLVVAVATIAFQGAHAVPEVNPEDFVPLKSSKFGAFVVNEKVDFSAYSKVIFFPATFDRMEISRKTDKDIARSWQQSSWKEMDRICEQFDVFAKHVFKGSDKITLTRKGGDDVFAIEFRIMEFHPMVVRDKDADRGTVATSQMGALGALRVRAVIANAKSGELIGVIEDTMSLSSSSVSHNNRTAQNRIWRKTFKQWLTNLRDDLESLQADQQDILGPGLL